MFLKKRMIATAAVIAMAAAAVYGSTQEMSQTQDTGERLQLFRGKETIYCGSSVFRRTEQGPCDPGADFRQ